MKKILSAIAASILALSLTSCTASEISAFSDIISEIEEIEEIEPAESSDNNEPANTTASEDIQTTSSDNEEVEPAESSDNSEPANTTASEDIQTTSSENEVIEPAESSEISEASHTTASEVNSASLPETTDNYEEDNTAAIDEHGSYTTKEDVALYIHTYNKLPENFITKKEAEKLGWSGGSLEKYAPGKCIGGSYFGNYEKLLPEKSGREYHECDIDTLGAKSRGAKRIVYSNDGLIYYTGDHYESFELLYGEE